MPCVLDGSGNAHTISLSQTSAVKTVWTYYNEGLAVVLLGLVRVEVDLADQVSARDA
jgi:hypothetical protein